MSEGLTPGRLVGVREKGKATERWLGPGGFHRVWGGENGEGDGGAKQVQALASGWVVIPQGSEGLIKDLSSS